MKPKELLVFLVLKMLTAVNNSLPILKFWASSVVKLDIIKWVQYAGQLQLILIELMLILMIIIIH